MDLLHFKISEYGISIASRIPDTEITLNNSDEYLGAGFLKIEPINSQTRRISTIRSRLPQVFHQERLDLQKTTGWFRPLSCILKSNSNCLSILNIISAEDTLTVVNLCALGLKQFIDRYELITRFDQLRKQ